MKYSLTPLASFVAGRRPLAQALLIPAALMAVCGLVLADARLPPGSEDPGAVEGPVRVLLDRGAGRFAGFVSLAGPSELHVDMKFWAEHAQRCAGMFPEQQPDDAWGWARMCSDAARFGSLRLAGKLLAGTGSREFSGTLAARDRGFNIDAKFRVLENCVKEIGVRGTGSAYTFFPADCGNAANGRSSEEARSAPFWPGAETAAPMGEGLADALDGAASGSDDQGIQDDGRTGPTRGPEGLSAGEVPLAPGTGRSRTNNLGPINGADQDLFPSSGFGYLQDLLPKNAPPLAIVQLIRSGPGSEEISFERYTTCHAVPSEVSRAFCSMAKALEGQSVSIADYGFNGQYGVGRFQNGDDTWFVRMRALPDQSLEAEFIRTQLHLDSDLGINPALPDAPARHDPAGRRRPVATEDLYPLEGFGHVLAFIENRMAVSGSRRNLLVQSGDLVLGDDQRLHVLDFGQCPPGVDGRFCEETQRAVYRSWSLEDYRYNGVIGTAELTYGASRYMVVLSKSASGRVRAQFYLANVESSARFRTPLGPLGSTEDAQTAQLGCTTQFRGEARIYETPTNHRNVPLAWCATNGSCADGQDISYLHALCELALREDQRISGRWAYFDGSEAIWGKACALPGETTDAAVLVPYGGSRFDTESINFGITAPYLESAESGRQVGQDGSPEYGACANCQTVGKLACEFFPP